MNHLHTNYSSSLNKLSKKVLQYLFPSKEVRRVKVRMMSRLQVRLEDETVISVYNLNKTIFIKYCEYSHSLIFKYKRTQRLVLFVFHVAR